MPGADPILIASLGGGGLALLLLVVALRPALPLRAPRAVLGLALALTLAAAAGLVRVDPPGVRLRIDASTEPLLPRGDPGRADYAEATRQFGSDEVFVVAMQTEDGVFHSDALRALRRVRDRIARLPGVRDVQSLVDVYSFRYVAEEDWVEVRPLVEEIPEDPAALAALRERALRDPIYRRTLVSDDGRTAAMNVSFRPMSDAEFIAADLDGRVRTILDEETAPGRVFHVAGRPHAKARVFAIMVRDLSRLIPAALLAMVLALAAAFARRRAVAIPLGIAVAANLWTFAAMAATGRPLTVLTVLLAPTLIALGCISGVHVYARYEEALEEGEGAAAAAARTLADVASPVRIAGFTTMLGFGALLVSDVPAVFELGAFAAFGVGVITLLSLTAAPAALAVLPPPAPRSGWLGRWTERFDAVLDDRLEALGRLAVRRSGRVLAGCGLAALLAAAVLPRIVVDTDYLRFFDPDTPVRRDFEQINASLAGAVPLFVSLLADEPGAFRDPALLHEVGRIQARLDAVPGVSRTLSVLDSLRVLNRAIEGDDPAEERIPDSRQAVSELLFMVPKGELARFINVNHSAVNLVVRTGLVGSAEVRELGGRLEAVLADSALPEHVRAAVTGNALLLARSADGIARSQPATLALAALGITLLVATSLRSLPLGLLAMLPNLLPVLLFFGLLGLGVAPLSLPTSLIGCVALGIAVDDTAHFLVRYGRERRAGADPPEAVRRCCRRVGRPIVITSVMLCAGFGVVTLSGLATLREFGWLSALTMAICLLADLVMLPALLARTRF